MKRVLLSWSTGKDCAWALHTLRTDPAYSGYEVVGLLTTFNEEVGRVAMHATRLDITLAQCAMAGLPLWRVDLPSPCSNEEYSKRMAHLFHVARAHHITHIAYGDLWLEDVRKYRESTHEGTGIAPLFPIWQCGRDEAHSRELSRSLAARMCAAQHKALLLTVDTKQLDGSFCGKVFEASLLASLPPSVDHCGEKGEFHTVCFQSPAFGGKEIPLAVVTKEEPVVKGQFVYRDVELLHGAPGEGGGGVIAVHLDAAAFAASEVTPEEWQRGAALGEALCPSE